MVIRSDDPQEMREMGKAAMLLSSFKYLKLDSKTAATLNKLKNKYLNKKSAVHKRRVRPCAEHQQNGEEVEDSRVVQNHQAQPELPQFEPAWQVWNPPNIPPVPCLAGHQAQPALPQFEPALQVQNPPNIPPVPSLAGLGRNWSKPFEKMLTDSDVNDEKSRLVMSKKHAEDFFLPLLIGEERVEAGILVTIYDSAGSEFEMKFKFWSKKYYVLTTGWTKFYKKHGLKEDDSVTICMFRHFQTGKLCFVITYRRALIKRPKKRRASEAQSRKNHKTKRIEV